MLYQASNSYYSVNRNFYCVLEGLYNFVSTYEESKEYMCSGFLFFAQTNSQKTFPRGIDPGKFVVAEAALSPLEFPVENIGVKRSLIN